MDPAIALDPSSPGVATADRVDRSVGDRRMRKLLRLPEDAPKVSIIDANNAFSKSIAISATRCLISYVLLPVLAPIIDLSGVTGPIVGIVLSLVSMVAIFFACRRFFAADHKWRWSYSMIAGGIFVLLLVQLGVDVYHLAT